MVADERFFDGVCRMVIPSRDPRKISPVEDKKAEARLNPKLISPSDLVMEYIFPDLVILVRLRSVVMNTFPLLSLIMLVMMSLASPERVVMLLNSLSVKVKIPDSGGGRPYFRPLVLENH